MRGKLWFLGGLAAGYVLGTRAGREKYEELAITARKIKEHPTVQEARGVVQEQANRLFSEGKDKLSQSRLAETKIGERLLSTTGTGTGSKAIEGDDALDDSTLAMSGKSGGTSRSTTTGTSASGTTRSNVGSSTTNSASTNY